MSPKRNIRYECTRCQREVGRGNLRVKKAVFVEMGKGAPTVKSRVVAWLCIIPKENGAPSCCDLDHDWNAKAYVDSPGLADLQEHPEHQ